MTYRTNRKTKGKFKSYQHGLRVVHFDGKWYGLDNDMTYDTRPPNSIDATEYIDKRKRRLGID